MLKIDMYNHILPRNYFDLLENIAGTYGDLGNRMRSIPFLLDLDARFRVMDEFGEYQQMLSLAGPSPEMIAGPDKSPELCRVANDGMAELCQKHPDRFLGFCSMLPMNNPEAIIEEIHRTIKDLDSKGAHIYTNADGKPLDLPEFDPIWKTMSEYDLPIWVHPTRSADLTDYLSEPWSKYEIWWTFGWPYETAAFMARMVFKGIFDQYPNLKMITHHGGGMVPFTAGRVINGWQVLGKRTTREDYSKVLGSLKRPYQEYFKMFYADTAMFGAEAATECALKYYGPERFVFASDSPFDPEQGPGYIRETIRIIDNLDISIYDRDLIYRGNALRLMNMDPSIGGRKTLTC